MKLENCGVIWIWNMLPFLLVICFIFAVHAAVYRTRYSNHENKYMSFVLRLSLCYGSLCSSSSEKLVFLQWNHLLCTSFSRHKWMLTIKNVLQLTFMVKRIKYLSTYLDGNITVHPKKIIPSGQEIMPPLTFLINLYSSSPIGCWSLLLAIKILICCALKCLLDKFGAQSSHPMNWQTDTFLPLVSYVNFQTVILIVQTHKIK